MFTIASIQDVAAIVGPMAAAVAAIGSLLTALQTRKNARESVLPDLSVELRIDVDSLEIGGTIHNAGTGVGRAVYFLIVHDQQQATGSLRQGVIRPNELFTVTTPVIGTRDMVASLAGPFSAMVAACRDRQDNYHMWTHDGRHEEWGRRARKAMLADRFHEMFPAIDLGQVSPVAPTVAGPL
jgi:hypothetical protein